MSKRVVWVIEVDYGKGFSACKSFTSRKLGREQVKSFQRHYIGNYRLTKYVLEVEK